MPYFVIKREWKEIISNKSLLIPNLIVPIFFFVVAYFSTSSPQALQLIKLLNPLLADLDAEGPVLVGRFYFMFFLIIPAILPLSLATGTIITEKMTGTLESVLVTPITTRKFLLGKILAFAIPPVVITWIAQIAFLWFIISTYENTSEFFTIPFTISALLLVPFISLTSVTLGVIVSSKVNNPSAAQQFGLFIVLPILAMAISQVIFQSTMSNPFVYWGILVIFVIISIVAFQLSVSLFQREKIISEWKSHG